MLPAAAAGLALLAVPAAQDSLRLVFKPVQGVTVHRIFQTHTRMTLTGVDSAGRPAERQREVADLGGMRQVSLTGPGAAQIVHLSYDSLRFRGRAADGPWREVAVPDPEARWIQARMDRHMRLLEITGRGRHPSAGLLVHLLTGVPGLVLPSGWVEAGDRWNAQLEFPLGDVVGGEPTGLLLETASRPLQLAALNMPPLQQIAVVRSVSRTMPAIATGRPPVSQKKSWPEPAEASISPSLGGGSWGTASATKAVSHAPSWSTSSGVTRRAAPGAPG